MRIILTLIFVWGFWSLQLQAQMTMNGDTIYGNEWIRYNQRYYKLKVAEEAVYKVSMSELRLAGFPVEETEGRLLQLISRGVQVPIYVSNSGTLTDADYLLFYGLPNRSEMDSFLFANGEADMLNPGYSLVNDTAAYFLTWNETPGLRYEMVPNDLQNLPDPELYFMDEIVYRETVSYIKRPNGAGSLSRFSAGEGFAGAAVVNAQANLPTPFFYAQGPDAQLEIRLASNNSRDHELQLLFNDKELETLTFNNFNFISKKYAIPTAELTTQNKFNFNRLGVAENRYSLGIASLRYPSLFQLNNGLFKSWKPNWSGKQQIVWTGLNVATQEAWLLDPQTNRAVQTESSAGTVTFGYSPSEASTLVLGLSTGFKVVPQILPITFENYTANTGNYLILSHEELINGAVGNGQVQSYADYRSSSDGGSFNVTVADVRQIYDQFGWGVDRHFIALRNFFHYLHKNAAPVEHILLLGKGRDFRALRTPAQVAAAASSFFVPTFGGPGADMLLVCGDQSVYPLYSLGRIPAVNGEDIRVYLDKVIEYENAQRYPIAEADRFWQKRVLHLSGGTSAAEQAQLKGIMERIGNELESNSFAANLFAYAKLSSDPVEGNVPQEIYGLINGGISLLSFLGHSGSTTIDFNIDNFAQIQNKGKYPVFLALGCSVGNVHTPEKSYGERFTFNPNKGAIAFIASSGLGYPSILENYSRKFYEYFGNPSKSNIGTTLMEVHREFSGTGNRLFQEQLEQTTINGDPALKLNIQEGPDFTFDYSTAKIQEGSINITQDSFHFSVDMINIGSGITDSVEIQIDHEFPDGTIDSKLIKIAGIGYRNQLSLKLPVRGDKSLGVNILKIKIDPQLLIPEKPDTDARENNTLQNNLNQEGFRFFIFGINASPAFPPNLALLKNPDITLTAFTGNLFAPEKDYVFEIDTIQSFSSDWKERTKIKSRGGVIRWKPDSPLQNFNTYYWRVSSDSISADETYNWENASFSISFDEGEGLSMRHHDQLRKLNNPSLALNDANVWELGTLNRGLEIKNAIYIGVSLPTGAIDGFNFGSMFPFNVLSEGVIVQVIDPETGLHWRNPPGGRFGALNTTASTNMLTFPFNTKLRPQRDSLLKLLNEIVPDGHPVVIYSILRTAASSFAPEEWAADSLDNNGLNLFNILENEGIQSLRSLENEGSKTFLAAYIKGEKVLYDEVVSQPNDVLDFLFPYQERQARGSVKWESGAGLQQIDSIKWKITPSVLSENDTVKVKITGADIDGQVVFSEIIQQEHEHFLLLDSSLEISTLELELESYNAGRITGQLKSWSIIGGGLPDLLIYNKEKDFTIIDTIPEGQLYKLQLVAENVGWLASDSSWLTIRLRQNNEIVKEYSVRINPMNPFSPQTINQDVETLNLNGLVQVELYINQTRELRESRYNNNFSTFLFYVEGDARNPLLRAYFDGIEIMDGDLVSAKPEIKISLLDENQYKLLQDTSLFVIQLLVPGSTAWTDISFSSSELLFIPAEEGKKNEASIIYKPEFLLDGDYHLRVSGRDASGNSSGTQAFQKRFQVITRQMISSLLNYPNPFSTQTRFLYTLTGSDSPEFFKIQIYTVGGQLVREIDHLEIGPLKVGTHLTDFVWDGRDAYGNQLANGVYIYRMHSKNSSREDVDHYETRSDEFSTNGWSKMVILR